MPRGPRGDKRPADVIGLSGTLWSMSDLAEMIDMTLPKPGKRGPYNKRAA
jgi:hypothetical protein